MKLVALTMAVAVAAFVSASAGAARPGSVPVVEHPPPALLLTHSYSLNWSGYASYGGSAQFTDVKGSWVQPTATCSKKSTYASFWVGLDGYNSGTVEQIGTDADCASGKPTYYAWYEMYPAPSVNLAGYPVRPGDLLSAEVNQATQTLTIKDSTQNWTYTNSQQSFAGDSLSSAEWIAEAPSLCAGGCHVAPLTNFGTVNFSGASTNGQAITYSGWSYDPLTMVTNGGQVKAAPTSTDGSAFSVTWNHS
jgi:Peptidase A4 family